MGSQGEGLWADGVYILDEEAAYACTDENGQNICYGTDINTFRNSGIMTLFPALELYIMMEFLQGMALNDATSTIAGAGTREISGQQSTYFTVQSEKYLRRFDE